MKRLSYYTNLKNKNQFLKLTKIEVASRKAKEKKEREDALDHKLMNKCRGMDENGAPLPVKFNTTPTIIFAGVDEKTLEREKQIMSTREVAAHWYWSRPGRNAPGIGRSLPAPRPRVREYVPGERGGKPQKTTRGLGPLGHINSTTDPFTRILAMRPLRPKRGEWSSCKARMRTIMPGHLRRRRGLF